MIEKPRLFRIDSFSPIYWGTMNDYWLYKPKRIRGKRYPSNGKRECLRRLTQIAEGRLKP